VFVGLLPGSVQFSGVRGHDAAVFANAVIPSAMISIHNENGSHDPHEDMKIEDFISGVASMRRS
jgi:N-carbamoyl-L-amino-acid hydrolase